MSELIETIIVKSFHGDPLQQGPAIGRVALLAAGHERHGRPPTSSRFPSTGAATTRAWLAVAIGRKSG
jgi:hypothetical protein